MTVDGGAGTTSAGADELDDGAGREGARITLTWCYGRSGWPFHVTGRGGCPAPTTCWHRRPCPRDPARLEQNDGP